MTALEAHPRGVTAHAAASCGATVSLPSACGVLKGGQYDWNGAVLAQGGSTDIHKCAGGGTNAGDRPGLVGSISVHQILPPRADEALPACRPLSHSALTSARLCALAAPLRLLNVALSSPPCVGVRRVWLCCCAGAPIGHTLTDHICHPASSAPPRGHSAGLATRQPGQVRASGIAISDFLCERGARQPSRARGVRVCAQGLGELIAARTRGLGWCCSADAARARVRASEG